MEIFYSNEEGEQFGPEGEPKITLLYKDGTVTDSTLIWYDGLNDWQAFIETPIGKSIVNKIRAQKANAAPPPPPPPPPRRASVALTGTKATTPAASTPTVNRITQEERERRFANEESTVNSNEVWLPDDNLVWAKARVTEQTAQKMKVRNLSTGSVLEFDLTRGEPLRANAKSVPDMTSLTHLHEASILSNLHERYRGKLPYTYMASVLIAINPLEAIEEPPMTEYLHGGEHRNASNSSILPPHPYALAENAHEALQFSGKSQSIVISGESGAGKTETAKIVLKYLVNCGSRTNTSRLDEQLLQSSPILESFGNAKTSRNDNSSRFGKFMKLIYRQAMESDGEYSAKLNAFNPRTNNSNKAAKSSPGILYNASVETYLLEKSRVVRQAPGERNYHIFYQLLAGVLPGGPGDQQQGTSAIPLQTRKQCRDILSSLKLSNVSQFNYLNTASTQSPQGAGSASGAGLGLGSAASLSMQEECEKLEEVFTALSTVGFTDDLKSQVLRGLLGVLLLGNITFSEEDTSQGSVCAISSHEVVTAAADLLGSTRDALGSLVTERKVRAHGEGFTIRLSRRDAVYARDAVAKSLYEAIFFYVVSRINLTFSRRNVTDSAVVEKGASGATESDRFIGVLDIFGFENMEENQFEQLLINYANEALQSTFNQQVLEAEVRLYRSEGIHCQVSSIPDNSGCVNLIVDKSCQGILSILDSVCRQPRPSDVRVCEDIHKAHGGTGGSSGSSGGRNKFFPAVHPKDRQHSFCVLHYAGPVTYRFPPAAQGTVAGGEGDSSEGNSWINKNNDSSPDGLRGLCQGSTLDLIRDAQAHLESMQSGTAGAAMMSPQGKSGPSGGDSDVSPATNKAPAKPVRKLPGSVGGASGSGSGGSGSGGSSLVKPTIATSFAKSMSDLNSLLQSSSCQFIRCVKPNKELRRVAPGGGQGRSGGVWDPRYVMEQLRSLGVLQTCEVLKVGLPSRVTYHELRSSLGPVIASVEHLFDKYDETVLISCILKAYEVSPQVYHLGRSRVFFKAGQLSLLEQILQGTVPSDGSFQAKVEKCFKEIEESMKSLKSLEEDIRTHETLVDSVRQELRDTLSLVEAAITEAGAGSSNWKVIKMSPPESLGTAQQSLERLSVCHKSLKSVEKSLLDVESVLKVKASVIEKGGSSGGSSGGMSPQLEINSTMLSVRPRIRDASGQLQAIAKSQGPRLEGDLNLAKENRQLMVLRDVIVREQSRFESQAVDGVLVPLVEQKQLAQDLARRGNIEALQTTLGTIRNSLGGLTPLAESVRGSVSEEAKRSRLNVDLASRSLVVDQSPLESLAEEVGALVSAVEDSLDKSQKDLGRVRDIVSSCEAAAESRAREEASAAAQQRDEEQRRQKEAKLKEEASQIEAARALKAELEAVKAELARVRLEAATPANPAIPSATTTSEEDSTPKTAKGSASQPRPPPPPPAKTGTDPNSLPEGWKEVLDKTSNRTYYVNKVTKERTWKRPTGTSQAPPVPPPPPPAVVPPPPGTPATVVPTPPTQAEEGPKSPPPPPAKPPLPTAAVPPMEHQDSERDGQHHQQEEEEVSQNSPYRPPSGPPPIPSMPPPPLPSLPPPMDEADEEMYYFGGPSQAADRASRRLNVRSLRLSESLRPPSAPHSATPSFNGSIISDRDGLSLKETANVLEDASDRVKRVDKYRRDTRQQLASPPSCQAAISVAYLDLLGKTRKTGYLMKQSKILGIWKKRFFVLEDNRLEYYDKPSDAGHASKAKTMRLTSSSSVSYSSKELCFHVKADDGKPNENNLWQLIAMNAAEQEEWMTAISGHSHVQALREHSLTSDLWDQGIVNTSFWRAPYATEGINRLPVGIRTLPIIDGPRTGQGIFPGEVVEVNQILRKENNTFLRLADDRGWVFELHPKARYALLSQVPGTLIEKESQYLFPSDFDGNLNVFIGPSFESEMMPDTISPGTTIYTTATWVPRDQEGLTFPVTFLKLLAPRGWVIMQDLETGENILQLIRR